MISKFYAGVLCPAGHDDGNGTSRRYSRSRQCVKCVKQKDLNRNVGKSNRKVIINEQTLLALGVKKDVSQEELSELINKLLLRVTVSESFIKEKAYPKNNAYK